MLEDKSLCSFFKLKIEKSLNQKSGLLFRRKEKFGGLLFDKQNFVSYYCNNTAWEIFQFIQNQKGLQLKDLKLLSDHLRRNFEGPTEFERADFRVRARLYEEVFQKSAFLMSENVNQISYLAAPIHVLWDITQQCNFSCKHCYSNAKKT